MATLKAVWWVELNTECPGCGETVDLTENHDWLREASFQIAEHGTDKTRDVEVSCPKCGHEFAVDLEY